MALQLPRSMSQPPITGPIAPMAAPVAAQIPMARPLDSPEKVCPRMARLFGMSIAAPMPCSSRHTKKTGSPGANAQPREASANNAVPMIRSRRNPK